jgi:protein AATF/BFR2
MGNMANLFAADFDPEEDGPAEQSDEESNSEESDDGLAGTEHYAAVG